MAVTVVSDLNALAELEPEWNRLFETGGGTPFQTYDWVRSWFEAFADEVEPYVIVVPGSGGLGGIAPLCLRDGGLVTFAGHPQNDYGGLLVDPGQPGVYEEIARVMAALSIGARGLLLDQLPEGHPSWRGLIEPLRRTRAPWSGMPADPCPAMLLDDAQAARQLYGKRHIANWTNWFERRGRLAFAVESDVARGAMLLETLFAQHQRRWEGSATPSAFRDPRMQTFYREFVARMMPKGRVHIAVLSLDDAPVALYLILHHDAVFYLYKPSYDVEYGQKSPGQVILRYLLEHALENGVRELDFTRGDEPYKVRFCNTVRRNHRVVVYRNHPRKWVADARRRLAALRVLRRIRGVAVD